MPQIKGVTDARQNFTELVNTADEHGEPVYITHFNEPRAVLIGYEAFERMQSLLEDLEDALAIYAGRSEPREPIEEARAEIEREAGNRERELQAVHGAES